MASVCFVVMPQNGDYWGVAIAQVWTLMVFFLGDRALLSSLKAKRLGESSELVQKVANLRALKRFERRFEVFSSREFSDNIVFLDSYLRAPAIVIGHNVATRMRDEDLERLLNIALSKLDGGKWRYACASAQLLSILTVPMILFSFFRKTQLAVDFIGSPCNVITKIMWRIGGIKEESMQAIAYVVEAYPDLWEANNVRVHYALRPFLRRLLAFFIMIPTRNSSVLLQMQGDDFSHSWESM